MKAFEYLFIFVNIITFITFGIDKYLAHTKRERISEKSLLRLALIGGSLGAIVAQNFFHHKTQKFKYTLWLILFAQIALFWLVLYNATQR